MVGEWEERTGGYVMRVRRDCMRKFAVWRASTSSCVFVVGSISVESLQDVRGLPHEVLLSPNFRLSILYLPTSTDTKRAVDNYLNRYMVSLKSIFAPVCLRGRCLERKSLTVVILSGSE